MTTLLLWLARLVTVVNIGLAFLMIWGASGGTGTRRELAAQLLGLLLFAGSIAAFAIAFRTEGNVPTPALVVMGALPALAMIALPFSPMGEMPVRDALFLVTAFALPPVLLFAAGRM